MEKELTKLLKPSELAKHLGVTRQCLSNWIKEGMPVYYPKPPRFKLDDVDAWMKRRGK